MPIRKAEKKPVPVAEGIQRTGDYSHVFTAPQQYRPIQQRAPIPASLIPSNVPTISTRDLGYFYNIAASLYTDDNRGPSFASVESSDAPPTYGAVPAYEATPPGYANDFQNTAMDASAVLVLWLFRQTRIDVVPIAERFHLGPADRQPLYSLTARPSIRSATEFNELAIQRRDPIYGAWYATCTSEIEPTLDLARPGNWTVAKMVLDSMPVWKKIVAGQVLASSTVSGKGNSLQLSWGDRQTLGPRGDAYGLWWDSGVEGGLAEAFFLIDRWQGFDCQPQGCIRVKPPAKDANGRYQDPRRTQIDLAVLFFHPDGKTPPQFVCTNPETHVRMDIIMAGLMTVLVVETRKRSVIKEFGALPAYDSNAHWDSTFVEEGVDLGWVKLT
ncbi:hypothetical protein P154DRAFT_618343 [Amniculicola lignicola CBS 123094]|uniref:Uncharacterized protein n=1 Tax=Amniculicola lignicola CBS 123094 TaxID=1392246 RepID=A0A6A5WNJ3_9PLEO|nr:hypothetical protein P154DRAFT_618343 [Amniculicola lignicola CBS 123094]